MSKLSDALQRIWRDEAKHVTGWRTVGVNFDGHITNFNAGFKTSDSGELCHVIGLLVPKKLAISTKNRPLSDDLSIEVRRTHEEDKSMICLVLHRKELLDIFLAFCEDVITAVDFQRTDQSRFTTFLQRLAIWQEFFTLEHTKGLPSHLQLALWGELWSFKKMLDSNVDPRYLTSAWAGLDSGAQDFRFDGVSVEVKTTKGNGDTIRISSEHQLKLVPGCKLFLFQVLVNVGATGEYSLNQLVDAIRADLNEGSLVTFNDTLIKCKYLDVHRTIYEESFYSIRGLGVWQVTDGFPALTENSLPTGISDCQYSLSTSAIAPFSTIFQTLITTIN